MSDDKKESGAKGAGPLEKLLWVVGGILAFVGGLIHMAQHGGMTGVVGARSISSMAIVLWLPGIILLGIAWLMSKARKG